MWVINASRLKKIFIVVIAALFAALILYVERQNIAVMTGQVPPSPQAISNVQTQKKVVALTFDINWGDVRIEQILNTLKTEEVKATFFVSGDWADAHHELIEKMKKEHYEIGSHGLRHTSYTDLSTAEVRRDLISSNTLIQKAAGDAPRFVRPPGAEVNKDIINIAQSNGQQIILSDINPDDTSDTATRKTIISEVTNQLHPGAIIRLHASDVSKNTAGALPEILSSIKDAGYRPVLVSELLSQASTKTKPIE